MIFTQVNKKALLKAIRNSSSIPEACQKVGISRYTFNDWMTKANSGIPKYIEFKKLVQEASASNPAIVEGYWDRKRKYTVTYEGMTGSLESLAKRYRLSRGVVHKRYMKHLSDPVGYPIEKVFRPIRTRTVECGNQNTFIAACLVTLENALVQEYKGNVPDRVRRSLDALIQQVSNVEIMNSVEPLPNPAEITLNPVSRQRTPLVEPGVGMIPYGQKYSLNDVFKIVGVGKDSLLNYIYKAKILPRRKGRSQFGYRHDEVITIIKYRYLAHNHGWSSKKFLQDPQKTDAYLEYTDYKQYEKECLARIARPGAV